MKTEHYDVVIVGAGISGAIVAKTLASAGKRVLVLEAGQAAGMDFESQAAFQAYQSYLNTYYTAGAKVPNSPYPNLPAAPSPDVLDTAQIPPGGQIDNGYFVQQGPLPFASDYIRVGGGTTMHWLGTCLRMLPNDFKLQSTYGQGVDWPIEYEDLRPYYELAERELGVSGDVADQRYPNSGPDFWGTDYELPMRAIPQSFLDQKMKECVGDMEVEVDARRYRLDLISTPQGRNSMPNPRYRRSEERWDPEAKRLTVDPNAAPYQPVGAVWDPNVGERCEGNASCVPICPVQAKYNALKTFKVARQRGVVVQTQSVASRLRIDPDSGRVTGVEYKRYEDPSSGKYTEAVATGDRYVLAAHSVENAKLLLASKACRTSGQVGRNLMDHAVFLTWGYLPERGYPYRGPGSTSNYPTFRDGDFRSEFAAFIMPVDNWGFAWPTFAPGTDVDRMVNQGNLFGRGLRRALADELPRQLLLHFECEQLPIPENRVTIDPNYRDKLGNYRPIIHYDVSDYTRRSFEVSTSITNQMFARGNIKNATSYSPSAADYLTYNGVGYSFNGAGHLVGTHRMGFSRYDSVVDRNQRTWDHENLYLVGCGNMSTLGTSNPTLTMSALAFWAAENILRDLSA